MPDTPSSPNPAAAPSRKASGYHASAEYVREVVFGMQDGMVSTLGAITGIAVGSNDHFVVLLSGIAIIAVESISMGIGSYTSRLSEERIDQWRLAEEKGEIKNSLPDEEAELHDMYTSDGWPAHLATEMVKTASSDPQLMLKEMAYRELHIPPHRHVCPMRNGVYMFFAYIAGGLIPLLPYFFFGVGPAVPLSIAATLVGLFFLGATVATYARQKPAKAGVHLLALGSVALLVGMAVGYFSRFIPQI